MSKDQNELDQLTKREKWFEDTCHRRKAFDRTAEVENIHDDVHAGVEDDNEDFHHS